MRRGVQVALALAAVAAALAPMLGIGFVNDDYTIIEFALHRPLPLLEALSSRAEVIEVYYRPLFDLSLALDFLAWGWTPSGFRLTNLALHLLNTLLVWRLARALRFDEATALFALLVFGLHPIHETSLYWIAGRTDVLCATFYLAALVALARHLEAPSAWTLLGTLGLGLLAMLTKEMAITLPIVAGIVAWWLRRDAQARERRTAVMVASLPLAIVVGGVLLARWIALDNNLFASSGVHGDVPIVHLVRNVATYMGLLVIPAGHAAIEELLRARPGLYIGLAVATLAVGAIVLLRWRRSLGPLLFCAAALLVTMIPVLRLTMRWYLYIPSIFFAIGAGWLVSRLTDRNRRAGFVAIAALGIGYAVIDGTTIRRWIEASELAGRLAPDIRRVAALMPPGDTLLFATVPGKVGGVPVFNLGFAGTVRHLTGDRDRPVAVASRLEVGALPVDIRIAHDSLQRLTVRSGAFFVNSPANVARQIVPGVATAVPTDAGPVIAELDRAGRTRTIGLDASRRWIIFDGTSFRITTP
jgi:hypothetical protein